MYALGKPNQDSNDNMEQQGPELDALQYKSVTGLEITQTQICCMMLPMQQVCKMERMTFKSGQTLKLMC